MDDYEGHRANNKSRRTQAAHDLAAHDAAVQRLGREAQLATDLLNKRACICHGALYKGGAYPHEWNCQGCSCTDTQDTPVYSGATRHTALRLEKPEEAVDIMEMEYKQWGKSKAMAHKHLDWCYDASFRGSVKNSILRKEAEVIPRAALVNAIQVKKRELQTVQDAQGPPPVQGDEQAMSDLDREHFTTIREAGQYLGLSNWDIHWYCMSVWPYCL